MMKKDEKYYKNINTLAQIIKARDNPKWLGAITGEVVKAPPELEVKLENGVIIKNHKIMISIEKITGYKRTFSIVGNITDENMTVQSSGMTKAGQGPHEHTLKSFQANGDYKSTGSIEWTDTLKVGDKVLMLPTNKEEYFYLIDKVVRL